MNEFYAFICGIIIMSTKNEPYIKTIYELEKIRKLIEEQNKTINWGPIVASITLIISAIVFIPNFGVLISIVCIVLSFVIFLFRKKVERYDKLITTISQVFIAASIIILILSLSSDFYSFLRQPLLNSLIK